MKKRVLGGAALCAAIGFAGVAGPIVAAAAATQKGGPIKVWVTPSGTGTTTPKHPGHVLITGAIGDYGPTISATAAGKPTKKNSPYKLLKLKHGTMVVTTATLTKQFTSVMPTHNTTNCTFSATVKAPIKIIKGTGAYVGITSTITFSGSFAAIAPRTKAGKCTMKTATKPLDTYTSFYGTGTATFS